MTLIQGVLSSCTQLPTFFDKVYRSAHLKLCICVLELEKVQQKKRKKICVLKPGSVLYCDCLYGSVFRIIDRLTENIDEGFCRSREIFPLEKYWCFFFFFFFFETFVNVLKIWLNVSIYEIILEKAFLNIWNLKVTFFFTK